MSKQKVTKEAVNNLIAIPDFFEKLGKNCKWFVLGLLSLMAAFLFQDFLLGKKVYLFKDIGSDTLNGIYPYLLEITRETKTTLFPKWSFEYGMGTEMFTLMFRDPFDVIIYYGSESNVAKMLVVKEFLKVVLSGFLFFLFLKEINLRNFSATIGAIMFSFSGFMILGGGWYYFSFEGFNLALLLYGAEVFLNRKKWFWFVFGIFLILISMPVNLFWHGLFLITYLLLRQYKKEQVILTKPFFIEMGKLGLLAFVGLLLSGPFFLEVLSMVLNSPRGSGDDSYYTTLANQSIFRLADKMEFGTSMQRFFSNDMLGGGMDYQGFLNFLEAPMFYCGLPCLLLMPQVFGFFPKKTRTAFIIFISLWCLPIIFPYFRNAFWLFTGNYYRAYSFFVSLAFILLSVIALDKILTEKKIHRTTLIVTTVLIFILMMYPYFKDKNIVNLSLSLVVKIFIAAYFVLFMFYLPKDVNRQRILIIFLAVFVIEALALSYPTVNKRSAVTAREMSEKVGYNDYSVEASKFIKDQESATNFYRVEKNYFSSPAIHGSLNDGMVNNYKGTSCYHSFPQNNYIKYLKTYGAIERGNEFASRWASGLINRPVLQSLNSVKYLMVKSTNQNPIWKVTHDSLAQFGDVKILRSKFCLPFGFTYDTYISQAEFDKLSDQQKEYTSLRAITSPGDPFKSLTAFNTKDTIPTQYFNFDVYRNNLSQLRRDSLTISSYNNNHIAGNINCNKNEVLCLSIPFDEGWKASVDGNPAELLLVNAGQSGILLSKGNHKIELHYELTKFKKGIIMMIVGLILSAGLILFRKKLFA